MAIFTCAECNFSKTVADEMAGKKARCPKCNAVNEIPLDTPVEEEVTEVDEPAESATESDEAEQPNAAATESPAESNEPDVGEGDTATDDKTRQSTTAAAQTAPAGPATRDRSSSSMPVAPAETLQASKGWLMAFGGVSLFFVLGIVAFIMRYIDISIICFGVGLVAFTAMAAMYSFKK